MRNKNWMLAAAWLLLGCVRGWAAEGAGKVHYNVDVWGGVKGASGLPENTVIALTQTRDGYLWLGTLNGIARFDGIQFKVFDEGNTAGLNSGLIVHLFEDSRSNLWVGTAMAGVALVKNGVVTSVPLGTGTREGKLVAACEDAKGAVWLCTADGQLARYGSDGAEIIWSNLPPRTVGHYRGVIAEKSGLVWYGTEAGQWEINTAPDFNSSNAPVRTKISNDSVDYLLASKSGGYWRLAGGKIQKWAGNQMVKDFGPYLWNPGLTGISAACEDGDGNLIVGTSDGIWWFDSTGKAAHVTSADGLSHNTILSLCVDHEGSLWVGTDGRGLDRVRRSYFDMLPGSEGKTVQSVSEGNDGSLWVGFNGGGVVHFKDGTREEYGDAPNTYVRSVFVDQANQVWTGTFGSWRPWGPGLLRWDGKQFNPFVIGIRVTAIFQDRKGKLWIGTLSGLARQDGKEWKPFRLRDGLSSDSVQAIADDAAGNLWIGTGAGLNRLTDGKITVVKEKEGDPGDDISALLEDADGVLWIGTRGRGLKRLKDGKWTRYTTEDGLISNSIGYIIEDAQTNLWMGSPAGFMRVSKRGLNDFAVGGTNVISCRAYDRADGLGTGECTFGSQPAACRTHDGKLWLPTIDGLVSVDPAQIKPNTNQPPVIIEGVMVEGVAQMTNGLRPILTERVVVPPFKERVDIQYASLNLAAADRARFKFRLEGHETGWTEVDSRTRTAHYPKLPPGDYRFHVIACNEDGVWNETGASLEIIVEPPFWRKAWFIVLATVCLLGWIVFVVHRISTQRLQSQLAGMRQQQALEKERRRIARDIHDQVGASLTQVSMLGEMVESDKAMPEEVAEHGRQISQTARETAKSLDEIVWAVNPSNDTLDGLITYFCKNAQEYLAVAGLRYRLDVPAELPATPIPPDVRHNVFMAAKEAVTNIVRHANASSAWIRLKLEPDKFTLEIEDNGKGMADMDPKRAQTRNGLSNMRKRLEEVGGSCVMSDGAEGGTLVQLSAPLGKGAVK